MAVSEGKPVQEVIHLYQCGQCACTVQYVFNLIIINHDYKCIGCYNWIAIACFSHNLPQLTWEAVNQSYQDQYPNVLAVFDLILTLPAHSADCERGFSHMKQAKSDWRSRLTDTHLSDILAINLESHSVGIEAFDPKPAIDLWLAAGPRSRRPDTAPRGPQEVNQAECSSSCSVSEAEESEECEESDLEALDC